MGDTSKKQQPAGANNAVDQSHKGSPEHPAHPVAPSAARRDREKQVGGHNQNAERQQRQHSSGNRHS